MRIGIVTLGCDKNTVDNEYLAGLLDRDGCEIYDAGLVPDENTELDAVVITTCGFIGPAKKQSVDTILEYTDRKKESGNPKRVFVAGCLSQRYGDELLAEIPEIDGLVGVGQFEQIAKWIKENRNFELPQCSVKATPSVEIARNLKRKRLETKPYAFLKVADGCNYKCTFCSIPSFKGLLHSVAPEILLEEARDLIAQGVKELNLVAQDLTQYGRDLGKDYRLPELLRDICAIEGDFWVRCHYCYPGGISEEFLEVMTSEPKMVPYLDMPLQHLDTDILKSMKRPFREVNTFDLVKKLRERIPNLTLRTTMLVGFPGETAQAYTRLLEGLAELRIDWMGAFPFSVEENTPSATMPKQVNAKTAQKRWDDVMQLQANITAERNERRIGQETRVLVEAFDVERQRWAGRSPGEAPEVDGAVYVASKRTLKIGEFVQVRITEAEVFDVYAEAIG